MTSNDMPELFSHAPAAEQTEQQPDTGAVPTPVFSNPNSTQPRDLDPAPHRRPRR
ncbi:hypothetical protein [Nocardia harenae]|uniref:hypothetical protein n=1 Tax=Nocardia harenae TaxID=358707 RepID=UPI000A9E9898|nr:hypothetical protein [Nocardia harenae]